MILLKMEKTLLYNLKTEARIQKKFLLKKKNGTKEHLDKNKT